MDFLIYAYTDKGIIREKNEDTIFADNKVITSGQCELCCRNPVILGVCDGVGGERSGEIASYMTADRISKAEFRDSVDFKNLIFDIHEDLREFGLNNPDSFNLQTTFCCAAIDDKGKCLCFNTGDSRLYFYRNQKARQISKDHSYVQELFDQGGITEEEKLMHPARNIITSSIGTSSGYPVVDEFLICEEIIPGDVIIVCSDGVSDYVHCLEIEAAMSLEIPFSEKIKALAQLSVQRGSSDNISIVAITPKSKKEAI